MSDLVPGTFVTESKPTAPENPEFRCKCGSNNILYRRWESTCGGFEDICYTCKDCGKLWWVEGPDA